MRWLLGVTDRDRAQRLPVRGQLQDRPDDIGGEDRRSDPAAAQATHRQCHQQRLHGGAGGDSEHGALGCGPIRVRVAMRTRLLGGDDERDQHLGCVVEDLASGDPTFDRLRCLAVTGQIGAPCLFHRVQQ